ncbi:hypothetical protein [Edaphobacter flagellatus]|uniref:hypothetical protein n=1 Tax=Edaphobacter flagellatus TaxID=1933044 RepID=UPI0021B1ADA2|nr:hypothetical protein [Edaphobacter flagellatus]
MLRGAVQKTKKPLQLYTSTHLFADQQQSNGDIQIYTRFDLPSAGALEYLRNLTPLTRDIFEGLTKQYKHDAFTIAGVNDQRIIEKVRDVLGEVVTSGGTAEDFRNAVNSITDEADADRLSAFKIQISVRNAVIRSHTLRRPAVAHVCRQWREILNERSSHYRQLVCDLLDRLSDAGAIYLAQRGTSKGATLSSQGRETARRFFS